MTSQAFDASTAQFSGLLQRYVSSIAPGKLAPGVTAFFAGLEAVGAASPSIAASIAQELADQRSNLKLIASENFSSLEVQLAQGTLLTDKYAEGYPGHRFYAGCDNIDAVEGEAADLARELFGAEYAYVQPHSGADANLVAFLAILSTTVETPVLKRIGQTNPSAVSAADWERMRAEFTGQRLLGMDYYSGGHLTHGYRHNASSLLFEAHSYTVDRESMLLDYDAIRAQAREVRPRILLAGYSAYPRKIDFARMREIADEVGATFMVDMAHFAGLVAGQVFTGEFNPVPFAHVVTTTTHKTLRGPRGGMVMSTAEFGPAIDKGCPMVLGGPLGHVMAAKAVAFREALRPDFRPYAQAVVDNARTLAEELVKRGASVVTGGTDNHLLLVDVATSYGITGRQAESALRSCGITLNRNSLPFDPNGPWYTSGLRLGSPAITTLGMGKDEIIEIADVITTVLAQVTQKPAAGGDGTKFSRAHYDLPSATVDMAVKRLRDLLQRFPLYPEIDLGLLSPG